MYHIKSPRYLMVDSSLKFKTFNKYLQISNLFKFNRVGCIFIT